MDNFDFRVYHKQEKRYGRHCDFDDNRIDYSFNGGYVDLAFCLKHPEWYKVEQWTGLLDKNGVKIFSGDTVKFELIDGFKYKNYLNNGLKKIEYSNCEGDFGFVALNVHPTDLEDGVLLNNRYSSYVEKVDPDNTDKNQETVE